MVRVFHTTPYLPFFVFNQTLARDGFRCMITGMFDAASLEKCAELQAMAQHDNAKLVRVQTCHILNESTMQGIIPAGISKGSAAMNKV